MSKKIVAIPGSVRKPSSVHLLIDAIAKCYPTALDWIIFEDIGNLPHFNTDFNTEQVPPVVTAMREQLRSADAIIICTPEYGHGIPGSLKNAIDWNITSSGFSQKPVIAITAATDGESAHRSLLETLRVLEATYTDELQCRIPFIKTKISPEADITDPDTLAAIRKIMDRLLEVI